MDKLMHWLHSLDWASELKDWIPDHKRQVLIPIIILSSILLQRISRYFLKRYIDNSSVQLNTDPTRFKFLRNMLRALIYGSATISIIYLIPALKKVALSLFASAGFVAAAIAFASQAALSNLIGGLFLVIFKPIRVNDVIKIGTEYEGIVEDINLRHTTLRNAENRRIIVPNSVMNTATIVNANIVDAKTCRYLHIPVSYDADLDKAMTLIATICAQHPEVLDVRTEEDMAQDKPKVTVQVIEFGEYYMQLRAYIWGATSGIAYDTCCDLRRSIKLAFDQEGIRIPSLYKNVYLRNANPQSHEEEGEVTESE